MKKIILSNDVNHLEDGIINGVIPVNESAKYSDLDVEFVDPVKVEQAEKYNKAKKRMMDKARHIIRTSPRNMGRKYLCMELLKKSYPDISLKEFCQQYVKHMNQDTLEDTENLAIAEAVEQDFLFGKGRQRRALRKKGVSRRSARKQVRKKKIIRKKVGTAARKAGKTVKRVAKKAASKVKATAIGTILLPLVPLKHLMVKELNKKGKPFSMRSKLVDVATAFYKLVVKGRHFEELPDDWYENDMMYYEPIENFSEDMIEPATITVIVTAIVSFIKKAREKKKKGLPTTDVEKVVADESEKVMKRYEEKTGKDLSAPSPIVDAAKSQIVSEYKAEVADQTQKMIMIGAAVLLLIIIFK